MGIKLVLTKLDKKRETKGFNEKNYLCKDE